MKKKLLIYSDCFTYSGSENVIENILHSEIVNDDFVIKFYYAYNKQYEKKVKVRLAQFYYKQVSPLYILSETNARNEYQQKVKKSFFYYCYFLKFLFLYIIRLSGIFSLINLFIFIKLYKKEKPDVLFINNGGYPGALSCKIAAIAGRKMKIKKVIFVINNMAFPAKNFLDKALDKQVEKSVTLFVTASDAAKEQLINVRNFSPSKCISIPNTLYNESIIEQIEDGYLRKEFKISKKTFILGSVGLLTKRKGYHILIEALNLLNKEYKLEDIICFIFGEGEERENLETQIYTHNLQEKVFLPGFRTDVLKYMADFDIFILPSTNNEDFPYVILEAMVLSKPIIGTNVAGIPEQVSVNKNGVVIEPNSIYDLKKAIEDLKCLDTFNNYGIVSQKMYKDNYSYSLIMKRYIQLFG